MATHILVYRINDYANMGGGLYYEDGFEHEHNITNRVQELAKEYEDKLKIICAGYLVSEIEFEPIKYAVKYKAVSKK